MPTPFVICKDKVIIGQGGRTWISEAIPMNGVIKFEAWLLCNHYLGNPSLSLSFEGTTDLYEGCVWTAIPATTISDPAALTGTGTNKYSRFEAYPWVRVKIAVLGAGVTAGDVTVRGNMYEEA